MGFDRLTLQPSRVPPSPRDIIKPDQITFKDGCVTIKGIKGDMWITGVADTNSMIGVFDFGHTVLLIKEFDKSKLMVGDIVVYQLAPDNPQTIIHRISKIGTDASGRWYKTRGDNNASDDPYKLRDKHLKYLCIGIIY